MTVELIDGCAGKPHISGDDLGNLKAGIVGTDGYVLATGNEFAATLESANSLVIDTGAAIMPTTGRHVRITAPETLTITSGTQGNNRNDLVVLRTVTSTDSTTVESASLVVIKGTATTGTAADPATQDGDLLLYRVSLSGISVSTPVSLFTPLTPLASLQASLYPVGAVYISTVATNPGTLFGFGTWEQITDRFLLACGSSYKAGATGGEASHKLSVSEMPSHNHATNIRVMTSSPTGSGGGQDGWLIDSGSSMVYTSNTGSTSAHNNMPPYLAVYMWKRTA